MLRRVRCMWAGVSFVGMRGCPSALAKGADVLMQHATHSRALTPHATHTQTR